MSLKSVIKTIRQAAFMGDAMGHTPRHQQALSALLQQDPEVPMEDFTFHPEEIISTIEGLQSDFKAKLSEVKIEETKKVADSDLQLQADTDERAAAAKELKDTNELKAQTMEALAASSKELTETSATLIDDQNHLKDLTEKCNAKSKEWDQRLTKAKLLTLPKGKQFDFSEPLIFGRFDLFCRRVVKLIDMFSTVDQFTSLSKHRFDGMEPLVKRFGSILDEFRNKRHDLLDFQNNRFDRDYVEFNVRISDLERALKHFIDHSFESISSIETSLNLLKKFQVILQRDNLRSDLESKVIVIFHNYGLELTQVQEQYEKFKSSPPLVRNLPPVAGNVMWSRHLLQRVEDPMKEFQLNPSVLAGRDAKKIIRTYNKMAKALVESRHSGYRRG